MLSPLVLSSTLSLLPPFSHRPSCGPRNGRQEADAEAERPEPDADEPEGDADEPADAVAPPTDSADQCISSDYDRLKAIK